MQNPYFRIISVLLLLSQLLVLVGMCPNGSQLELCPNRNQYSKKVCQENSDDRKQEIVTKRCVFCDPEILMKNHIISEDEASDVRVMMNLHPYFDFYQGVHLLIMPITHKEDPDDFSQKEFAWQVDKARELSGKFYNKSCTQEYVVNYGKLAGQSVKHWHSQLKIYEERPLSLPEKINSQKKRRILDIESAFNILKKRLEGKGYIQASPMPRRKDREQCVCCSVGEEQGKDKDNLVFLRFKHNYACLSHYPKFPGEVSVVPKKHVSAINYLPQEALRENMIIAKALLPTIKEYAQKFIRYCNGGNIYTKSIGGKASVKQRQKYHLHTRVIPRTTVPFTPGIEGNSAYLPYDPVHLFSYLVDNRENLKKRVCDKMSANKAEKN